MFLTSFDLPKSARRKRVFYNSKFAILGWDFVIKIQNQNATFAKTRMQLFQKPEINFFIHFTKKISKSNYNLKTRIQLFPKPEFNFSQNQKAILVKTRMQFAPKPDSNFSKTRIQLLPNQFDILRTQSTIC